MPATVIKKLAGVLAIPALLAGGVLTTSTPADAATSIAINGATIGSSENDEDNSLHVSLTYACDRATGTATIAVGAYQGSTFGSTEMTGLPCDGTSHTVNATLQPTPTRSRWYNDQVVIRAVMYDDRYSTLGSTEGEFYPTD